MLTTLSSTCPPSFCVFTMRFAISSTSASYPLPRYPLLPPSRPPTQRRTHRDVPVNPPPTRLTVDSPEYTRTGAVALTNGDPIGFPTSAKGIEDPEEAYWFGVLGYQHYAEEHEEHERGWHNELDGFRRVDETGQSRFKSR